MCLPRTARPAKVWLCYSTFCFMFYTGLLYGNVEALRSVSERAGIQNAGPNSQVYAWIGSFVVIAVANCFLIPAVRGCHGDNRGRDALTMQNGISSFVCWLTLVVVSHTTPCNRKWKERVINSWTYDGQHMSISCWGMSSDSFPITLPNNVTTIRLLDREWTVDWDKANIVSGEEGWQYALFKVIYTGPVSGCRFDDATPLYAPCVDKPVSPTKCGMKGADKGGAEAWSGGNVNLLRIDQALWAKADIDEMYTKTKSKMSSRSCGTRCVYEWNSWDRESLKMIDEQAKKDEHKMFVGISANWFAIHGVMILFGLRWSSKKMDWYLCSCTAGRRAAP